MSERSPITNCWGEVAPARIQAEHVSRCAGQLVESDRDVADPPHGDPFVPDGRAQTTRDCTQRDRDREDGIYFATDPLDAPVEVAGRVQTELYVSTDVPDTTFMVKLLDIYPDGYEALIAHGTIMARYHNGLDRQEPLQEGTVYKLTVDLWSTAIVFARGHRIGLYVTSSDAGRLAVHPNSYEPVDSYQGAPVAHNTVLASAGYPSRLILPMMAPGVSIDYDPAKHRLCDKIAEWDK